MKQYVIILGALFMTPLLVLSQSNEAEQLPTNPDTKKVSISQVVEFPGLTSEEIRTRVNDWVVIQTNESKAISFTKKKKVDTIPALSLIYCVGYDANNQGSKLTYKTQMPQLKYGISTFGPQAMSGYEYASLIILIKDGKMKYEFTDFEHEPIAGYVGGIWLYETKSTSISKKNWMKVRSEGLDKYQKIAQQLIDYVKKPVRTDMNF